MNANLSGSFVQRSLATATTTAGMAMTKIAVIRIRIGRKTACTSSAKRFASSRLPSLPIRRANKGTKPWLNAPSPSSRRSRLGSWKAQMKTSAAAEAPMTRANTISRAKPRIRLTKVSPPMVPPALRRFIAGACALELRRSGSGRLQAASRRPSADLLRHPAAAVVPAAARDRRRRSRSRREEAAGSQHSG